MSIEVKFGIRMYKSIEKILVTIIFAIFNISDVGLALRPRAAYERWVVSKNDITAFSTHKSSLSKLIMDLEEQLYSDMLSVQKRYNVIETIGKIRSRDLTYRLLEFLSRQQGLSPNILTKSLDAIGRIELDEIPTVLKKLLSHHRPFIRAKTLRIIGKICPEEALPILRQFLDSEEPYEVISAAEAINEITPLDKIPQQLINLLKEDDLYLKTSVLSAIGRIKPKNTPPEVVECLRHWDIGIRGVAINVVGKIGQRNGDILQALIEALSDDELSIRLAAVRAIGEIYSGEVPVGVLRLLHSQKEKDVIAAIKAIGEIRPKDVSDELKGFLNHSNPEVRVAAIEAIANIIDPENIPDEFIARLNDPRKDVRLAAIKGIGNLRLKNIPRQLLELLDEDRDIQLLVLETIRKIHPPTLPRKLINFLDDSDPMVRKRAAQAIGTIRHSRNTIKSRGIMVPARLDTGVDYYGTKVFVVEELKKAIEHKIIIPLGQIWVDNRIIHNGFSELSEEMKDNYRGIYQKTKDFLIQKRRSLRNVFLVPAADPLKPAENEIHNRSLYTDVTYEFDGTNKRYSYVIKGTGMSCPYRINGGLVGYAKGDRFLGGFDEDELYASMRDTELLRNAYRENRLRDPVIKLAEFFGADIDTFTHPVAGFEPIFLPMVIDGKTELVDAVDLLKKCGVQQVFISKRRFYLYRTTIPTRNQQLDYVDGEDKKKMWDDFFRWIGYKRRSIIARHNLLFQTAARYALSIHICHDIIGRSFYKKELGGVFTGEHNTNPLTIFDMDTMEEKEDIEVGVNIKEDIIGAISLIEILGKRLRLKEGSIRAAVELFKSILLSDSYNPSLLISSLYQFAEGNNRGLRDFLSQKMRSATEPSGWSIQSLHRGPIAPLTQI